MDAEDRDGVRELIPKRSCLSIELPSSSVKKSSYLKKTGQPRDSEMQYTLNQTYGILIRKLYALHCDDGASPDG